MSQPPVRPRGHPAGTGDDDDPGVPLPTEAWRCTTTAGTGRDRPRPSAGQPSHGRNTRPSTTTSTTEPDQQPDMDHHHRRVVLAPDLDAATRHGPGDVALRDDELDDPLDADRRQPGATNHPVDVTASPLEQHQLGAEPRPHRQQKSGSTGSGRRLTQRLLEHVQNRRGREVADLPQRLPRQRSLRQRRSRAPAPAPSSTFGPPGCATQCSMSPTGSVRRATARCRQRAAARAPPGRGTVGDSTTRMPDAPTSQPITRSVSGKKCASESRTRTP